MIMPSESTPAPVRERTSEVQGRGDSSALHHRLMNNGCEFDFFQAVWLLERWRRPVAVVGDRGPVAHEMFRFRPDVSMGFPATDVRRVEQCPEHGAAVPHYLVEVTFLGLYGASTPLPLHYAIEVLRSAHQAVSTVDEEARGVAAGESSARTPVRDFLDIFHHRLISFFYRSWLKYRYERSFGSPGRDRLSDYLLWYIGCAPGIEETLVGLDPVRLLRYAGALTQHPKSATTLEGLLSDFWGGMAVKIEQCVGRWVLVPHEDQNVLGARNCRLGVDLTVGEQVFDLSGAFDVVMGPMDFDTYVRFLPRDLGFEVTRALVALYCTDPLANRLELRLLAKEAPELCMASDDSAARLGYTSWVRTAPVGETSVCFLVPPRFGYAPARAGGTMAGSAAVAA